MYIDSLVVTILSGVLIWGLLLLAPKLGLLDIPNRRSAHHVVTPRGAGIAFLLATFVVTAFFHPRMVTSNALLFLSLLIVFSLGIYDDYKDTSAKYKFYIIIFAAVLVSLAGVQISTLGTYFEQNIPLKWLAIPVTIFAITGFTNALNLIDGLDGLAGSLSVVILGGLWIIGYNHGDMLIEQVTSLMLAALFVFILFNWNPAKIFMGDSGSLTIGFLIAALSIKALAYVNPIVILYIAAIPIIDTVVVMARRISEGRSIIVPDKNHLHHILLNLFNGRVKITVVCITLLQMALTLFGLFFVTVLPQEITLPLFLAIVVIVYFLLSSVHDN